MVARRRSDAVVVDDDDLVRNGADVVRMLLATVEEDGDATIALGSSRQNDPHPAHLVAHARAQREGEGAGGGARGDAAIDRAHEARVELARERAAQQRVALRVVAHRAHVEVQGGRARGWPVRP